MNIKLYTTQLYFVYEATIPSFITPPEIIIFGDRVFKLHLINPDVINYIEIFAYIVFNHEKPLPKITSENAPIIHYNGSD